MKSNEIWSNVMKRENELKKIKEEENKNEIARNRVRDVNKNLNLEQSIELSDIKPNNLNKEFKTAMQNDQEK